MINILKQAGFKVCRENANLYLKYSIQKPEGDGAQDIIVFFTQRPQEQPVMTVFERAINYNVTGRDGLHYDYAQDDALRVNAIRVDSVEDIFATLNKFGYNIALPSVDPADNALNSEAAPFKPTSEQDEARERIKKDVKEMTKERTNEEANGYAAGRPEVTA
jgi:hypothetical protein